LQEDTEVWSRFLAASPQKIDRVWYDVRVGEAIPGSFVADPMKRRIADGVLKKRIDVVCKVGGGYWVVEIKPVADMQALGQIQTYTRLFLKEFKPDGECWPVIVADTADPDILSTAFDAGVLVMVNRPI
jgi:hypothetical protein